MISVPHERGIRSGLCWKEETLSYQGAFETLPHCPGFYMDERILLVTYY